MRRQKRAPLAAGVRPSVRPAPAARGRHTAPQGATYAQKPFTRRTATELLATERIRVPRSGRPLHGGRPERSVTPLRQGLFALPAKLVQVVAQDPARRDGWRSLQHRLRLDLADPLAGDGRRPCRSRPASSAGRRSARSAWTHHAPPPASDSVSSTEWSCSCSSREAPPPRPGWNRLSVLDQVTELAVALLRPAAGAARSAHGRTFCTSTDLLRRHVKLDRQLLRFRRFRGPGPEASAAAPGPAC